ncbi:hypothetical protein [Mycoplana ramosa]|uniref:Uncharacterized protein n=1 Tax=Mycoplana ramosa TaxID=40837 RepID=A0ABW3Z1X3_MYCRA
MSALSADRNTPRREGEKRVIPVAAATLIYAGALVAINAAGNAVPFSAATGLKSVGRAERRVNNTGAAGEQSVEVSAGIFRFANSTAADLITKADIGSDCYGVDDQTVAKTSGSSSRSVAGKVFDVDAQGVWVQIS